MTKVKLATTVTPLSEMAVEVIAPSRSVVTVLLIHLQAALKPAMMVTKMLVTAVAPTARLRPAVMEFLTPQRAVTTETLSMVMGVTQTVP